MKILQRPKRAILIAVGSVSTGLAVLGAFLPLLPTTPFLLLAAACFSRSSERLNRRLAENRYLGPYLASYLSGKPMPRSSKIISIAVLWASISFAALFMVPFLAAQVLLAAIASSVTAYIATR